MNDCCAHDKGHEVCICTCGRDRRRKPAEPKTEVRCPACGSVPYEDGLCVEPDCRATCYPRVEAARGGEVQAPDEIWVMVRKLDGQVMRLTRPNVDINTTDFGLVRYVRAKDGE